MKTVQEEIVNVILDKPYILFEESSEPVPHVEILKAVQTADAGIIAYPQNLSTANTVPTKLYEYLGYRLPILLIDHHPWVEICKRYNAAITFQPGRVEAIPILAALSETAFYTTAPVNVFWEYEEGKFLHTIDAVLK
jgi:hypothetical protein